MVDCSSLRVSSSSAAVLGPSLCSSPIALSITLARELDYGITVVQTRPIEGVSVYALSQRVVKKLPPTTKDAEPSEAIDEINVSPVEPFERIPDTHQDF